MAMKKLLLAGVAALAVLTGPAAARPWVAFYCGKLQIAMLPAKYFNPNQQECGPCDNKHHYFDMTKDPNNKHPLPDRLFRDNDRGLFYKGKLCREFEDKDYEKLDKGE
jgi:hypothetical protein